MALRDWFKDKEQKQGGRGGLITAFYSETVPDRYRREEIRGITIPRTIKVFTTGPMNFMKDGSLPEVTVRFDAYRDEKSGGWNIRRFREVKESTLLAAAGIAAGEDDAFMGRTECDFDALRFLSEESAGRGFRAKNEGTGHQDMPHWKNIALQIKQPIDAAGCVQPVVKGQVLADNVTFDDPEQIALRDSTRPSAIAAAQSAPKQQPAKSADTGRLAKIFYSLTRPNPEKLFRAVREGDIEEIKRLLDRGVNMNAINEHGGALLHFMARYGSAEIARLLLDKGADVNVKSEGDGTPLHWAAGEDKTKNAEIVRVLLEYGSDVNAKSKEDETPLHCAMQYGTPEAVRQLLAHGANVSAKNKHDDTPLDLAVWHERQEIVRLLLDYGADADAKDKNGKTPQEVIEEKREKASALLQQKEKKRGTATPVDNINRVIPS